LAQIVALAISRELALRGGQRGQRLGSEAELASRHKVSRAVLREALRMLETHGLVATQRGTGGGLLVGTADPRHTIECAARYLKQAQLAPAQYFEVRRPLELGAVEYAMQRASPAELESLQRAADAAICADLSGTVAASRVFQERIGELSANRALSLLLRILLVLTSATGETATPPELVVPLKENLRCIAEAIHARDVSCAKRFTSDYLKLIGVWF
jgi:DNA-binding FadR family transcriptional regulator